ncbi:ribose 5-phosphate isomerase B [Candidatus Omnitrophota bacterium]
MKIAIGSDHGGYELKVELIRFLTKEGYQVKDFGTHSKESCDYPLIGFEVARAVGDDRYARGILICKTGVGMVITANKLHGVRAVACYNEELAKTSREHNDCNVIVLAASYTEFNIARKILKAWLSTEHLGQRHARRVGQIKDFEKHIKRTKAH